MPAPNTRIIRPDKPTENDPAFEQIAQQAREKVGYVFLTVLAWDRSDNSLKRIYSTDQLAYPTGGSKYMPLDAPWPKTVIVQQKVHACWNIEDLTQTYNDAATIVELGAGSCICIPVVVDGRTMGALNFMGKEGEYDDASVKAMEGVAAGSIEAFSALSL